MLGLDSGERPLPCVRSKTALPRLAKGLPSTTWRPVVIIDLIVPARWTRLFLLGELYPNDSCLVGLTKRCEVTTPGDDFSSVGGQRAWFATSDTLPLSRVGSGITL